MEFNWTPVPPPAEVPVQPEAKALGLIDGLRVEKSRGNYRCANCNRMNFSDWIVYVPDSVMHCDSAEDIKELCRLSAYNGHGSGWCLPCAKALGKSWLQRLFSLFS